MTRMTATGRYFTTFRPMGWLLLGAAVITAIAAPAARDANTASAGPDRILAATID